jgi:peptide/nickel transport system substrate-binding protein
LLAIARKSHAALAAALALTASLALGACGDDAPEQTDDSITIGLSAQPDALDPALSYAPEAWESLWLVYTPLLTYEHAEGKAGTELIPGLAEGLPAISEDGKSYELTLREGLEYSDGTPVRASDFEHSIKRVLNLESPGTPFFGGIIGAEDYIDAGKAEGDIEGIETDDGTGEITIELVEPDATFSNALAMTFAGLVPGDTAFEDLTKTPPPGVGPYQLTSSEPNRQFVLERSEGFDVPGIPQGNVRTITAEIVKDERRATEDVIRNRLDYIVDPPVPDQLADVRERYADRYEEFPTASIYYFFLNSRVEPFDDQRVREAVNHAIDERAIARLFGGLLEPTCNFLPPDIPGYRELDPCPWGDPNVPPDLDRAKAMIDDAGAAGAEVTIWGNNEPEPRRVAEYFADTLNRIGLDARPKIVDASVYLQTVGNQKTEAQTGFANFFQDFPHPANFMTVVDGDAITQSNNLNWGNVDVPEVNAAIDRLSQEPQLRAVEDEWAEVDRRLVEEAWVAPWGNRKLATFMSERMNFDDCSLVHPLYQNDYTSFCLE